MDKLNRMSLDHGNISEKMTLFNKLCETFKAGEAFKNVERLLKFSDEYIAEHFKFEEEEIFPMISQHGNAKEKKIIQELLEEHIQITNHLDKIKNAVFTCDSRTNKEQIQEVMLSCKVVINMKINHAKKEDVQLFNNP